MFAVNEFKDTNNLCLVTNNKMDSTFIHTIVDMIESVSIVEQVTETLYSLSMRTRYMDIIYI